jgi:membrane protease subunit HflC
VDNEARKFGLEIIDARIRRVDLPRQISEKVFDRMRTERAREAAEYRAFGAQEAAQIKASAQRDATVIVADTLQKGETLRGDGDAERAKIFADAFNQDTDFFAFYRSMQAYETALKTGGARFVLSPSSEFFRYFNSAAGKPVNK